MNDRWAWNYLELAFHVAQWSKDPSTQVGAVLVDKDRRHEALGINGFPRGIADDGRLHDRAKKYVCMQHAERNVLDKATFDAVGSSLYVTLHPCSECAKSIISKGVSDVYTTDYLPERWAASARDAAELFAEAGVRLLRVPLGHLHVPEGLAGYPSRNRKADGPTF